MNKVNILGTYYTIEQLTPEDDEYLNEVDGFCDKTSKRIVVKKESGKDEPSNVDDYDVYLKTVLRHEIVHAFLFESGLHNCFTHPQWGHDETMVDWIAVQFPKMLQAFQEVGCLPLEYNKEEVHAKWIGGRFNNDYNKYEEQCSNCLNYSSEYSNDYCSHCGATMDEK